MRSQKRLEKQDCADVAEARRLKGHKRKTVPAYEAWLWKNKQALAMVQKGLEEARHRRHAKSPNLAASTKLVSRIKSRAR